MKTIEQRIKEGNARTKDGKKNRKLSSKNYDALMELASVELGVNDYKHKMLGDKPSKPKKLKEMVDDVIITLSYCNPDIIKSYEQITYKRRIKAKDRLGIIGWLIDSHRNKKPMCIVKKKNKVNKVRRVGLKKWGDVKDRPFRIIPDEHFLNKRNRKKHDAFDRLNLDKKVEWARHANRILGDVIEMPLRVGAFTETQLPVIDFAMRYACKLSKISNFRGIFARPYWIADRADEFGSLMTSKEYDVFMEMVLTNKKSSRILSTNKALERLVPIMRNLGLYRKYMKWFRENHTKVNIDTLALRKATELIKNTIKETE